MWRNRKPFLTLGPSFLAGWLYLLPILATPAEKNTRQQLTSLAAVIQRQETELLILEKELNLAREEEEKVLTKLHGLNQHLRMTFHYLRRAANQSPLLALLTASKPEDIIHASVLLRSITPEIHRRNQHLLGKIKDISHVRGQLEKKQENLRNIAFQHHRDHEILNPLMTRPLDTASSPSSLSDGAGQPIQIPVAGKFINTYGSQAPEWISYNQGALFMTRRNARVISPVTGVVAFAGEYANGKDKMVIIQTSSFHLTLSGLGSLTCSVGQNVVAGQAVGCMPVSQNADAQLRPARLYIEIWQGEQTIDPKKALYLP